MKKKVAALMVAAVAMACIAIVYWGGSDTEEGSEDVSVSLDKSSMAMDAGKTAVLVATLDPSGWDGTLVWKSSDVSIATVSGGVVTAVSPGTATITVSAGASSASCVVTVSSNEVPTVTVELNASSLTLDVGASSTLTAVVSGSAQAVSWKSSDDSIATVSNGVVKAMSPGTATITAASGTSSASCVVTVKGAQSEAASIDGLTVTCVSGTDGIVSYVYDESSGEYTVTFGAISEDTEYSISGVLNGNIVVDVDSTETFDFDLDLEGVSITSSVSSPIVILSADDVTLRAGKGTSNTVTDSRPAVDSELDGVYSAAVYSKVDLKIKGKGTLEVTSENNNGIHTKDDLKVEKATLTVSCLDNALKGNDSVTISSGNITLYARQGDGIKTSNSETTDSKQKGTVTVNSDDGDTVLTIYAACDGIDAAYDVVVNETEGNTLALSIFTDAYYPEAETVSVYSDSTLYLKVPSGIYGSGRAVYVQFSDGSKTSWAKASYLKQSNEFRSAYYYLTVDKPSFATKMTLYVYSGEPSSEAASGYLYCSSVYSIPESKDLATVSSDSSSLRLSFSSYSSQTVGPGGWGMPQEGNSDKTPYS
ncbi:MAG: carbohydrate-binding domain-containing protein, partial [Candidatus Methanomethylophilaceae archaeon]|nr:carbohydrate-binding domain-containing protein [Candidatus Methanomethylophilaceae archaeon]